MAPRGSFAGQSVPGYRLADLARRIRETPRAEILDLATRAIVHGAKPANLLAATFLAGVHDVQPRPVGGNLHSVMSVEASYRLVEQAASAKEAWLVALWNLDAFKETQNERGDPWVLPPAPKVAFSSEAAARKELIAALDTWDEHRADRAIVGLLPFHSRESLYEILWPYTARCMAYLGHKVVYGAMTEAVLRRIEWQYAEPAARSLVYGLVGAAADSEQHTRAYEHAIEIATSFPKDWLTQGKPEPAESKKMARSFLTGDYRDAQKAVAAALGAGLAPQTIWDAVRLGAADLFLRRGSNDPESGAAIRAVHAVTEVWSLGHAWRATQNDRSKRLLLLQAAAWVPELRDTLLDRNAISMEGSGIATLGDTITDIPSNVDDLLETRDPALARAFLDRRPEQAGAYLAKLRSGLAQKGLEYHQFKLVVALEDEISPSDPRWISRLLAPAAGYMPTRNSTDNELTSRSTHALLKARIL